MHVHPVCDGLCPCAGCGADGRRQRSRLDKGIQHLVLHPAQTDVFCAGFFWQVDGAEETGVKG